MMKLIGVAAVAFAAGAVPALANGDWTGGYVGGQVGNLDVDGTGAADGDDFSYGIHGGYRYDFGTFVLGGELEYDWADVDLAGAATVDNVLRLKATAGYDFGPALAYVAAGWAEVDTSLGDDTGGFYGLGVAYQINPQFELSAEALWHEFNNINGTGVNADATSINLRASFRF